jgi:hypothetical protein
VDVPPRRLILVVRVMVQKGGLVIAVDNDYSRSLKVLPSRLLSQLSSFLGGDCEYGVQSETCTFSILMIKTVTPLGRLIVFVENSARMV